MPRFAIKHIPYAGEFDGSASLVDFGDVYDKERTDSFSFSFWFKPRDRTTTQIIFQKRDAANTGYEAIYGLDDGKIRMSFEGSNGNVTSVYMDDEVIINKWQFITFTYGGTNDGSDIAWYIDGESKAVVIATSALDANMTNATDFRIGARDDVSLPLNGLVTDFRIHNAELTAAEVSDAYFNNTHSSVQDSIPFNEGAGSTVTSTGAIAGAGTSLTWANGPMQKRLATRSTPYVLAFDGVTDDVECDGNEVSNGTTAYSMACWVKTQSTVAGDPYAEGRDASDTPLAILQVTATGLASFLVRDDATNLINISSTEAINNGQWHLIVGVRDGTTTNLYVDGRIVNTGSDGSLGTATTNTTRIGAIKRIAEEGNFLGLIGPCRSWSVALTAQEIEDFYFDNIIPQQPSMVKEYLMSEGTGSTVADTGTGGNDGTITGATWANGPMQKRLATRSTPYAGEFDGSASLVDFGNNYDKDGSSAFGFSFWFKTRNLVDSQSVFEKRDLGDEGYEILFGVTDGTFRFNIENTVGGQTSVDTDAPLQANRWYFVTIVYDGTNDGSGTKFYINGLLVASSVIIATFTGSSTNATDFRIGARDDASLPFNGLVTDFRIHNAELTAAEVSDAYFNNVHSSVQDYIPFSEGAGTTVTSTGAVAGTATSLTWNPNNTPF